MNKLTIAGLGGLTLIINLGILCGLIYFIGWTLIKKHGVRKSDTLKHFNIIGG